MEEEQQGQVFQNPPQYENTRSGGKSSIKKYVIIVASIVVIGLLIFGVMRFFGASSDTASDTGLTPTPTIEEIPTEIPTPSPDESPTPTEDEETTPSPSPSPKPSSNPVDKTTGIDRSQLSIRIMNGGGVTGAAKKASDYLEGLGYNIIQIGNADNSDYAQTEIQIKTDSSDFLTLLKKDVSANYTVGSTSNTPAADEKADAVVIIGKE